MRGLGTTVTIQRIGVLVLSSSTERTTAVTGSPSMVNFVFSPRNWAYRQRRASFGSMVSNRCIFTADGRGTQNSSATTKV